MPVGTQGTVKTLSPDEIEAVGSQIILGNTYHLYLRPGTEVIEQAGGLHRFASWSRPILTDSGGYQVFSLASLRKISQEGVVFQSHHDGSYHKFTPESVVEIQRSLGSDIMMVLDECPPYPSPEAYVAASNELTLAWAERAKAAFESSLPRYGYDQALFGIVQGGTYPHLRRESVEALVQLDFPGYAIGGLSVGEPKAALWEMTQICTELLPKNKPRYLMGVGKPDDLIRAIAFGIDMFDCVIPTRNGRKGQVFTWTGPLNLRNAQFKQDFRPIDESCGCYACRTFSRAYLRHLFQADEMLGMRLGTLHNLHFYHSLVAEAREQIAAGTFDKWQKSFLSQYKNLTNGEHTERREE
jgi:queuine tRNA-ribosyltransferase